MASDRVRLVAFTDGATGDVIVQRLDEADAPTGDPLIIGRTTRELYSNAQFYDAALAVGAVDDHVVLVYDDGRAAGAVVSPDGGQTWTEAWREAEPTTPSRLVTHGAEFIVLEAVRAGAGGEVRVVASDDGGATWTRVGSWTGRPALTLSLSASREGELAAWATCRDVACSAIDLRVGDLAAGLRSDPDRPGRTSPAGRARTRGRLDGPCFGPRGPERSGRCQDAARGRWSEALKRDEADDPTVDRGGAKSTSRSSSRLTARVE